MQHSHQGVRLSLRPITVAVLLALAPASALALGLGQLVMHSGLDEPLNGQIELISPTAQELKTLKASLASREDFDIAGAERLPFLFDIKYNVSHSPSGKYFIQLTTDAPVREPFLHLLVQVDWNGGKLIREYSALLDPPHWVAGAPAEINPPEAPAVSEPPVVTAPQAAAPAPVAPAPTASATAAPEELPPIGTEPPAEKSEAARAEQTQLAGSSETPAPAPTAPAPPVAQTTPEAPVAPATAESPTAPPTEAAAPAAPSAPVTPEAAVPAAPAAEPAAAEPAAVPQAPAAATSDYGPVKSGETLSHIAKNINADPNLTSQQVMIAVLHANPSAFFGNNINNLRTGKILRIPEQAEMAAVSKEQAASEFRAQYDAWQEYKLKLASTSRMVTVPAEQPATEPEKTDVRKVGKVAKAEKPAAQKSAGTKAQAVDLLKIVRANLEQDIGEDTARTPGVETQKNVSRDQGKLNERVATLEEAIDSKQMQNKEMRERVGKLQEQVKNTERLINLENKDLAQAQKQTAEKQAAEAAAKAAADKAAADKAAADKAAADKAAADKAAADKAAADKVAAAKLAEAKKPVAVAPKKPITAAAPAPQEGFLSSILANLDNSLTMALLGVVGVLAAGMGGLYAYRRRRASREFSESILSSNSLNTDASITDTSGQAAPSDTSFLSDFSQGGMGNIHTDEVDPIAEAEVYLAYGRDEQAEEILKDAIVKDPVRQELKGKLLEIYFQRNDVGAFETLAEELYAQLEGKGGKVWDKVEEMGRKLSPSNPMFRGGAPSGTRTAATAPAAAAATTLLVSEPAPSAVADLQIQTQGLQMDTVQTEASPSPAGGGMDFNIDFGGGEPAASPAASQDISFDLDAAVASAPAAGGMDIDFDMGAASASGPSSGSIDFDLPGETLAAAHPVVEEPVATAEQIDFGTEGLGDLALDLDNASAPSQATADASLPGWDETATKLDLAKAYIDMGDSEGARSILDEVIAEGNDQQKQQARELVSQIAA